MSLNSREFKFLKNYRNLYWKSSARIVMRMCKLITLLILDKKEFNHFFKSWSSDIVLIKQGNLHQNAKHYQAYNTERSARWESASEASRFLYIMFHQFRWFSSELLKTKISNNNLTFFLLNKWPL